MSSEGFRASMSSQRNNAHSVVLIWVKIKPPDRMF